MRRTIEAVPAVSGLLVGLCLLALGSQAQVAGQEDKKKKPVEFPAPLKNVRCDWGLIEDDWDVIKIDHYKPGSEIPTSKFVEEDKHAFVVTLRAKKDVKGGDDVRELLGRGLTFIRFSKTVRAAEVKISHSVVYGKVIVKPEVIRAGKDGTEIWFWIDKADVKAIGQAKGDVKAKLYK